MGDQRPNRPPATAGEVAQADDWGPISVAAGRRWLLGIALAAFAVFWLVLLTGRASPGLTGMFVHLLLALGASVGFAIAAAVVFALVLSAWSRPDPVSPARGAGALGPVLDELEAVRRLAQKLYFRRWLWMAPLAIAGLALLQKWLFLGDDNDFSLIGWTSFFGGVVAASALAALPLARPYARLYKARVVPMLIGTSSELHYQRPPKAQLQLLQALFPFDVLKGDDALVGSYRGLAVVIAQVRALRRRSLRWSKVAFDGLVVEVTLLNRLSGDTIVVPAGARGPPHEVGPQRLAPVGLEDRAFESAYDVFSDDQVMARALLTPDFMERFRGLDRRGRFGQPLCLGHANQLFVALPTARGGTIFTPPGFDNQAASDPDLLAQLKEDFAAVLRVIDSVVDLDSRTRMSAAPVEGRVSARSQPTLTARASGRGVTSNSGGAPAIAASSGGSAGLAAKLRGLYPKIGLVLGAIAGLIVFVAGGMVEGQGSWRDILTGWLMAGLAGAGMAVLVRYLWGPILLIGAFVVWMESEKPSSPASTGATSRGTETAAPPGRTG
ncbi:MAG TPA: DUF3137 domain-containing protein [Caulobacteraceae bacterium]|nr:DUF3137 domain-containing protein [Caulobacteraceae bacterium]